MLKFERFGAAVKATYYEDGKAVGFVLCDERVAQELATMDAILVARRHARLSQTGTLSGGLEVLPPREVVKVGSGVHRLNFGNSRRG